MEAEVNRDDFSYSYQDYDENPDPDHRPMYLAPTLRALSGLAPGAAVLDAGCGGGLFSVGLSEAGFAVYGMDMSESGIRAAKARGIGQFEVASVYNNLARRFGREDFDAIVAVEVIEHLYSPARFAEMAFAAVKPGGVVVITTPYWGYAKNIVLAVTNRIDRSLTALWEGGHIKHFSRKTLSQLMRNAGFEVTEFKGCGEGWRGHAPGLWNGMMMAFRKPL
jgi:2-polyprenyl-3-methyl-5-hydroxy-6-metoxy-1,4-benzoquinol methylase